MEEDKCPPTNTLLRQNTNRSGSLQTIRNQHSTSFRYQTLLQSTWKRELQHEINAVHTFGACTKQANLTLKKDGKANGTGKQLNLC